MESSPLDDCQDEVAITRKLVAFGRSTFLFRNALTVRRRKQVSPLFAIEKEF
jgi:hypothetical protein